MLENHFARIYESKVSDENARMMETQLRFRCMAAARAIILIIDFLICCVMPNADSIIQQ